MDLSNTDFTVSDQGSIVLLSIYTDAAKEWVAEHLPADATRWGNAVVIEHRYANDIVEGIEADGLTVGVA